MPTRNLYITAKTAVIITVLLSATGLTTAISDVSYNRTVSPGQSINITVNAEPGQDLKLHLLPPRSSIEKFSMSSNQSLYWTEITGENLPETGRYGLRFQADNGKYPENSSFGLTVSSLNQSLRNKTLNASDKEHYKNETGDFCHYKTSGDFSCEYENFQAQMILSSAVAYYVNSLNYSKEKFYNFTLKDWASSGFYSDCLKGEGDFNCGDTGGAGPVNVSSGTRQGTLIHSLWRAYD